MQDLFYITLVLFFFALSWGLVRLCQNLREDQP
jgi:hypothetical protein